VVTKVDAACTAAETAAESAAIVAAGIQTSRARLGVPVLDTLLLHHYNMYHDHGGAAWQAVLEAQQRGEVRLRYSSSRARRIVILYHHPSTLCKIHEHIRCLYF
jgi:hypothetical protein